MLPVWSGLVQSGPVRSKQRRSGWVCGTWRILSCRRSGRSPRCSHSERSHRGTVGRWHPHTHSDLKNRAECVLYSTVIHFPVWQSWPSDNLLEALAQGDGTSNPLVTGWLPYPLHHHPKANIQRRCLSRGTDAGHGGQIQLVSLVTVTGVTLGDTDTPAVLTAVEYPTILGCIQAGVRLVTSWKTRRWRKTSFMRFNWNLLIFISSSLCFIC